MTAACRIGWSAAGLSRIARVTDRYGSDILSRNPHTPKRVRSVEHPAERGLVVEDPSSGFVGAVVRIENNRVDLEDRNGRVRSFPLGPGFLVEGKPVILTAPKRAPAAPARTASGSVAVAGAKARVALASRDPTRVADRIGAAKAPAVRVPFLHRNVEGVVVAVAILRRAQQNGGDVRRLPRFQARVQYPERIRERDRAAARRGGTRAEVQVRTEELLCSSHPHVIGIQ